jgi:signal recognition particle subunit SRP54
MFDKLSSKITEVFKKFRNQTHLSERHVDEALKEMRMALLEADVSLVVVKQLIESIRDKAIGQEIIKNINATQMMIKIVHDVMVDVLSVDSPELNLKASPHYIMMVGLQGSGKTTTSAKLAYYIEKKLKKKTLLVSLDVYRPAAQEQLKILSDSQGFLSLPIHLHEGVFDILKRVPDFAKTNMVDVVILDTAGRLHIDDDMLKELQTISLRIKLHDVFLVSDMMTGQDSAKIAKEFLSHVPLSGLILTRADGDGRGGATLSMGYITGRPIKFLGMGEKIDQLEEFSPKRIAGRILDQGDIVSLVEKAQEIAEVGNTEDLMKMMIKKNLNFNDFHKQLLMMLKMGKFSSLLSFIPGFSQIKSQVKDEDVSKTLKRHIAIILSMTPKERKDPLLLNGMRRKRIAKGAGVDIVFLNKFIKQFEGMNQMMKKMKQKKGLFSKF